MTRKISRRKELLFGLVKLFMSIWAIERIMSLFQEIIQANYNIQLEIWF